VPSHGITIENVDCVVVMGAFQGVAHAGTEVDVVVCVPLDQTHATVSPQTALTLAGIKLKSATSTVWIVALAHSDAINKNV